MTEDMTQALSPRPDYLPEKFWDGEKSQPRLEAMAQSYREMERKFGAGLHKAVPTHHGEYCVDCKSDLFAVNPVVNERLHRAGFTQDQVQLVYDLAHEALEPLVAEITASLHAHQLIGYVKSLAAKIAGKKRRVNCARGGNKSSAHKRWKLWGAAMTGS